MTGLIDAYASNVHYGNHLLPVLAALPDERRGHLYGPSNIRHVMPEGTRLDVQTLWKSDAPILVAAYQDARMGGRRPKVLAAKMKRPGRCVKQPPARPIPSREAPTMAKATCSQPDCSRLHYGLGLCQWHYRQNLRGCLGDPPRRPNRKPKVPFCTVDGCDDPVLARGLCSLHYGRWRTRGTTDPRRMPSDLERFNACVDRDGPVPDYAPHLGPCWIWTGAFNSDGYSAFWHDGATAGAYRAAYKMFVGPIPGGLELDHLCRNRACVNPGHVEPVTKAVNRRRRPRPTHCHKGHPFTPENTVWRKDGSMRCRICKNDANRIYLRSYRKT